MSRLRTRVARLETRRAQQRGNGLSHPERMQRVYELLSKLGVAEHELDAVQAALCAMTPAERKAWLAARRHGEQASPHGSGSA